MLTLSLFAFVLSVFQSPDDRYYGSDRLFTIAFLRIKSDSAFVDLVFNQRVPRDLLSDTLLYDSGTNNWVGDLTSIRRVKQGFRVSVDDESSVFGGDILLKRNPKRYDARIDELRNLALRNKVYSTYISNHKNPQASEEFLNLERKYDLNKSNSHSIFRKKLQMLEDELGVE